MTPRRQGAARAPVLIANRGEIAVRVARTCRALGFPTVAVYSDADSGAYHARYCDRAIAIGPSEPAKSYLNIERLIEAAKSSGAKYVHPGYGFLSENEDFAEACAGAGITFVGPSPESIRRMGNKIEARAAAAEAGVAGVPGSKGAVPGPEEAAREAQRIGFPVLLKAAAGGGGKGMRRVDAPGELTSAFEGARREAEKAFGDGSIYVEKFIVRPRHIEVQVFGDGKGGAVHLGERECSVQRRHQKIWEESPSPFLESRPDVREAMLDAGVRITRAMKYAGAGTIEFVVDPKGSFHFLEMNTRLQVEHPVTEWVTGVDLVAWQLLLAAGELALGEPPARSGAAIEARVYAEDPVSFLPAAGPVGHIQAPQGPFVRWDSCLDGPGEVSLHYDPMIAKMSVWGRTRDEALARMRVALEETQVEPPRSASGEARGGLRTNLSFLRRLAACPEVASGDTTTDLIERVPSLKGAGSAPLDPGAAIALSLYQMVVEAAGRGDPFEPGGTAWSRAARAESLRREGSP